jgi:hypothetical protein
MFLTLTTTHQPATDLGFLLHKHADKHQEFSLAFGTAHVFYPEATAQRCTAAMRHADHRFEWSRAAFRAWAESAAARFGYHVRFDAIGEADAELGAPTQMGVFTCN